jgi:epoxyqueuosine reductase
MLKTACEIIQKNGSQARIINEMSLRSLAIKSGLATILGKNQMVMHPVYGSYLVLGAIETDDTQTLLEAKSYYNTSATKCDSCDACVIACPTKALSLDGKFEAAKCLRNFQSGQSMPKQIAELMDKRFLGCNTCQVVCPHNSHIAKIEAPDYVEYAVKQSIFDLKPLKQIIGSNYARPKYMNCNAIVYAANTNNQSALSKLYEFKKNPTYHDIAEWAISKLKELS